LERSLERPKSFRVLKSAIFVCTLRLFGIYIPALESSTKTVGSSKRATFPPKELSEYMYQTFKNVVNEDFSDEFSKYDGKALICWGKEDTATPLSAGKKIHSLIKDSTFAVYAGDHYFFMQNAEDIAQKIEKTFLSTLGQ
jgi:pimeloyl-ACP methyl ester carboxylesterase